MFSPKAKSFRKKDLLNQSLNNSLNQSLTYNRRKTTAISSQNKSFFGLNQSKNFSNNASMREKTVQNDSCFQIVDFKGQVPKAIASVVLDSDVNMHLKLQLNDKGVAVMTSLEGIYIWHLQKKQKHYELSIPYLATSSAYDDTSSFMQAAVNIPQAEDLSMESISCLAVTTNGSVFYWRSIASSKSLVEINISSGHGDGDICVDVVAVDEGFLVGWMSGALSLLLPYQNTLKATSLRQQATRMGSISRRVSSLFFGSSQEAYDANCGVLRKLLVGKGDDGGWKVVVIYESYLQLWSADKMHFSINLLEMAKTYMSMQGLPEAYSELCIQNVQLIGSEGFCDRLAVLITSNDNQTVTHHIVFLNCTGASPSIQKLVNTHFTTLIMYNGSFKTFKLLTPNASDTLLYSMDTVVCAKDLDSLEDTDDEKVEVFRQMIIGAGVFKGQCVMLTKQASLVSIRQAEALLQLNVADSLLKSQVFADLKENCSGSGLEEGGDLLTRFKRAFISCMINNEHKAFPNPALIDELLSVSTSEASGSTPQLDHIVLRLSKDMIDDYPSSHPNDTAGSFTTSVILSNQLEDKLNAHNLFIHFLNKHFLWDKLTWTRDQDGYQATTSVLRQHAEKLAAVSAIKELYNEESTFLGNAIDRCMQLRIGSSKSRDHFFREVSKVHQLVNCLVEEEVMLLDKYAVVEGSACVEAVLTTSKIVQAIMDSASAYSASNQDIYSPPSTHLPSSHRLAHPWTSSTSLLTTLKEHHSIIHFQLIPALSDKCQLRDQLFQSLFRLTEYILHGMKKYIEDVQQFSIEGSKIQDLHDKYADTRSQLISPFITDGQADKAVLLAENFGHFELLVQLNAKKEQKLFQLMQKYQNMGFPRVVFEWFCKERQTHQLFSPPLLDHPELEAFITQEPFIQLSWIYYASKKDYLKAFNVVFELAVNKMDNVGEKMNLLSYAKLYGRLSMKNVDIADKLEEIDDFLHLLRQQLQICKKACIMEKLAVVDAKDAPVFTPIQLVETHIEGGYKDENVLKSAFDLLKYINIDVHNVDDIIIDIWTASILSDDWSGNLHVTSPLNSLQHLTTFKLISLLLNQGLDMNALIPPASSLFNHSPLSHLSINPLFKQKLLILFEHAQRS